MKTFTLLCATLLSCLFSFSQLSQTNIGSIGSSQFFTDTKFDPADGSTVNVGYINDPLTAGNGNDCFITKINANHQIVWQKIIPNPGDDVLNKISICSNGDYVVAGKIFQNGIIRGLVCRINSTNGNIIWSTSSSLILTPAGEEFFDLIETVNQNIAVVGYTNYTPPNTRGIIVLLNSAGQEIYSRISNYVENSTGFRTISQLPNNNLIVSGLFYVGSYSLVILEMNELTAALISQNTYAINTGITGINSAINSLQPSSCNVLSSGKVYFQVAGFTGSNSSTGVVQCIYEYDQNTKNLSGNIYYHNTPNDIAALGFYPVADGDFLISQTFINNTENIEYVSRITNGTITYDRNIEGNISVSDIDVSNNSLTLAGSYNNGTDVNAYALFYNNLNIPTSSTQCKITNANILNLAVSNLSASSNSNLLLIASSMAIFIINNQSTNYLVNDLCTILCNSQLSQTNIGSIGSSQFFTDTKFDPADGSTVNVGYINDPLTAGNGNDCFITKINANHQIVWQKIIPNPGDDVLNKISICSNGDYVVAGKIFQNGIIRGLVCRINSTNGNIIWSTSSSLILTPAGEEFFDLIETVNQNIAVVGYTNYTPPNTRGIIVLLNSAGQEIYSRISNYVENSTGFRTISQLPNNNLIVSGLFYVGSYSLVILEMNELTAALISQNTYAINTGITGINSAINSLQPSSCNVLSSGKVYFQVAGFTGSNSSTGVVQCIYEYDQNTKNLSGNIYYHNTPNDIAALGFYPVADGDFLISQTFINNTENIEYVSRITNGTITYDRNIEGNISVSDIDVSNNSLTLAGSYNNGTDVNAYALFSGDFDIAASSCPCNITNENTLNLFASNLSASTNATALLISTSLTNFTATNTSSLFSITDICGFVLPISLKKFDAFYNSSHNNTLLEWSTESEFNSKIFILEKSIDGGRTFITFGSVEANGTSNTINQYNFTDPNPVVGINYYRLKQIDGDDKYKYSNVISVLVPGGKSNSVFTLYPNPASHFTYIKTTTNFIKEISIEIVDASGKLLRKNNQKINFATPVKVNLSGISKGIYFIKILSENSIQTERILIN